ncbi:MAG: Gfo/Idh/MocA family oxidoreductase [Candidatus Eremiobacteraeota bacterium]|nr:Gfo/Idh/MocA family oxidoreductase [Candidatus Eremiobacteraeota bacterium]
MKKVAVVGSGKWGTNLARNFLSLGALEVICEISAERARELQKLFPGVPICDNVDSILSKSTIEGVVVATPPFHHYEVAVKALRAGKHLFVEKPMTIDPGESEKLIEEAGTRAKVLMVGHILLYHPAYAALDEVVKRGDLGEICSLHAQRIGFGRARKEEDALFSLAPHDISVMISLFNEQPCALSCVGMSYLNSGIADMAHLHLMFSGQKFGHIHVSWLSPEKVRQHTVVGTRKMAKVDEVSGPKGTLTVFDRHIDGVTLAHHNGSAVTIEIPDKEPLLEECRHFLEAMEHGSTPRSDGHQGLTVVKILNLAKESMERRGEWIAL